MKAMEDAAIVELFWQRQEQALDITAVQYGGYCMQIARRILGNEQDAEECVSDVYQAAWDSIPPNRPENLRAYLGKLVRRISMKRWRSMDTQKRGGGEIALSLEELQDCIPDGMDLEAVLRAKDLVRILNRFLESLPKQERQVFVLRYWHGCSVREIRSACGFSKSKVETMLFRTRKKLRQQLWKEGYDV